MKNKRLIILSFLFFLTLAILSPNLKAADGDSIKELNILVNILENGDAKITEEWKVHNGGSGTEWYKPIDNLNHMGLEDFTVYFDGWEGWDVPRCWVVQDDFNNKMNRYGIHKIGANSFELCWGKTKRNTDMTYKLEYIYTNFVQKFPDGNCFNVKFVNDSMDPAPKKVTLVINPYRGEFNKENSQIWAFGTSRGEINFEMGRIVFRGKNFKKPNYLTVLVKSTEKTLPSTYEGRGTFEDLKNKALEGSDYGSRGALKEKFMIMLGRYDGVPIIFPIFISLFFILALISSGFRGWFKTLAALIFFGAPFMLEVNMLFISLPFMCFILLFLLPRRERIKLPKEIEKYEEYNRESILKYSFKDMYALSDDINKIYITKGSTISAAIMSLINKDILEAEEYKNHNIKLRVKDRVTLPDSVENGIVNAIYKKYRNEFADTEKIGEVLYENRDFRDGLLPAVLKDLKVEKETKGFSLFKNRTTINEMYIPMVQDIIGMQNFLKDFTLIKEKEIRDIELWEEYLVMATLLNMPYKVIEALENACPEPEILKTQSFKYSSDSIRSIDRASKSYSNKIKEYNRSVSSSGGGGRSSSGGGGGSSGGGSGGGSR